MSRHYYQVKAGVKTRRVSLNRNSDVYCRPCRLLATWLAVLGLLVPELVGPISTRLDRHDSGPELHQAPVQKLFMFLHRDQRAFPLFDDRIIHGCAKIVSWCPTRDLVVLVKPDNAVLFLRGGVVQIWSMECPVEADIVALAWKPNGKEFVFGCSDGSAVKVDATHDTPSHIQCWPPGPAGITSLAWIAYSREAISLDIYGFDPKAFDLETSLPSLSMVPPKEPAPIITFQKIKQQPLPEEPIGKPEEQSLLLIGDDKGQIHLSLNGMFHIGTIQIAEDAKMTVADIAMAPDMISVQALLQSSNDSFSLVSIDSQILQSKRTELCNIAVEQTRIDFLLRYITQCASVLEKHHSTITKLATSHAERVSGVLLNHDERMDAMPEVELLGLVATGNTSEALHDYFTNHLTEQDVKRWETRGSESYSSAQTIACEYLQPACERLLLHLGTLYGYSRWTERYEGLLEQEAVKSCIDTVNLYLDKLRAFVTSVSKMIKLFQEFIAWMSRVVERFSEQNSPEVQNQDTPLCVNPDLVIEYLNTSFVLDSLADYFVGVQVSPRRRDPTSTLKYTLHQLATECKALLKQPSATLAEHLKTTELNHLRIANGEFQPWSSGRTIASCTLQKEDDKRGYQYYAFAHKHSLTVVRNELTCSTGATGQVGIAELVLDDDTMHIADMEFFDTTELGLIVQQGSQSHLGTVAFEQLSFQPTTLHEPDTLIFARVMALPHMTHAVMGTNGNPRRRIVCVVARNGKILVLEMDPAEPGDKNSISNDDDDEAMDG